ncbi:MAG: methyltransferase domain-containing protein [Thermoplasmata archaeon]
MEKREDLNKYLRAYSNDFKFKNENEIYLNKFADIIKEDLSTNFIENYLSFGIGHKIVSNSIIENGILTKRIKNYYIIDGSKELLDSFKNSHQNIPNLHFIHTYFEDFDIPLLFDRIEMGFILEHVDDPLFILSKYKNYLKSNGKIHIAVPNAKSLHRLIGYYSGLLNDLYQLSEYDLMLGHKRYYDIDTIKHDILSSGLQITKIIGLMLKPITNEQMKILGFNDNIIKALVKIGENYPEIANCIYLCATK